VIASSGTALTTAQGRLLKRFAAKVVLSFDPDAAGKGAAAKTSELLVAEGFQVNVAVLPAGDDPDTFIQKQGGAAYQEQGQGQGEEVLGLAHPVEIHLFKKFHSHSDPLEFDTNLT